MKTFGFIRNKIYNWFAIYKNWFMTFTAGTIKIGDSDIKTESPIITATTTTTNSTSLELTDKELELLLLTIKNGLFRGEYVETVYNLTLKLQKQLVDLKYKNNKL